MYEIDEEGSIVYRGAVEVDRGRRLRQNVPKYRRLSLSTELVRIFEFASMWFEFHVQIRQNSLTPIVDT